MLDHNHSSLSIPSFTACLIAAFAVGLAMHNSQACAEESAKPSLHGKWLAEKAELAGQAFPDEVRKAIQLKIAGEEYEVAVGATVDKGKVKVDQSKEPHTIDIEGTDGPNKGKTIQAIFRLDGDTLEVCYDLTGKNRPKEFKSPAGSQTFLVSYKRAKE